MILAVSSSSVASGTGASPTDNNIPNDEVTASQTQASNSSASAAITITTYAVAGE